VQLAGGGQTGRALVELHEHFDGVVPAADLRHISITPG
jgi:hypothetical protein